MSRCPLSKLAAANLLACSVTESSVWVSDRAELTSGVAIADPGNLCSELRASHDARPESCMRASSGANAKRALADFHAPGGALVAGWPLHAVALGNGYSYSSTAREASEEPRFAFEARHALPAGVRCTFRSAQDDTERAARVLNHLQKKQGSGTLSPRDGAKETLPAAILPA